MPALFQPEQSVCILVVVCRKKYIIEKMDGEKIVSRKQGITTVTCIGATPLSSGRDAAFPVDQFQICRKVSKASLIWQLPPVESYQCLAA